MKNFYWSLILLSFSFVASSQKIDSNYVDGEVFLKFKNHIVMPSFDKDGLTDIDKVLYSSDVKEDYQIIDIEQPFRMTTSEDLKHIVVIHFAAHQKVDDILEYYKQFSDVDYIEKVPLYKTTYTPNDLGPQSGSGNQWGLHKIQAEQAWNISTGDSRVTVAVVDNAVQTNHPDLAPVIWTNPGEIPGNGIDDDANGYIDDVNGWDAADNDNDPNPVISSESHGTHCAGTVGCATDNGTGIASIGFGVSIIAVKCNRDANAGTPTITNTYAGFTYAATVKANVISCSFGGGGYSSAWQSLIDYAYNTQGCLVIAAAGNSNANSMMYPCGYNNVMCVAWLDQNDKKADWTPLGRPNSGSNYGSWVDVGAPGEAILSTVPFTGYGNKSGTSMATPLVAGLAGLLFSVDTSITRANVESCLLSTADNIDAVNPSYVGMLGSGRINAHQALLCAQSFVSPTPPIADFYSNDTLLCVGGNADFFCTTPNATTFSWSFPGGTPSSSTIRNPTGITYSTPGFHNVSLTVTNSFGNDQLVKNMYIFVDSTIGCPVILPPNTTMPVQTSCIGTLYDDGGPSAPSSPNQDSYVTIAPTGATTVDLSFAMFDVEAGSGSSSPPCDYDYLEIYDGPTTSSPLIGRYCNSNIPSGTISSTGGAVTIYFHTDPYVNEPGFELDWVCNTSNPSPVADFSANNTTICTGATVNFTDNSLFATSWSWNFTGGTPATSTLQNPSVIYNSPGTYAVSLTVTNSAGSDTKNINAYINVVNSPNANFSSSIAGLTVNFNNTSSGGSSYNWDFGDGNTSTSMNPSHTYATGGSYTVCLIASGPSCSPDTICQTITVSGGTGGLIANFSVSRNIICEGSSIDFYDQSIGAPANYNWTFQGGTPSSSTLANPTNIVYNSPGVYDVTLTVSNSGGAHTTTQTAYINVTEMSTASFNTNMLGTTAQFTDNSSGASSWNWDFGDGNSSNLQSPTHTYPLQGTYTVCLTTSSVGCPNDVDCQNVTTNSVGIQEGIFDGIVKLFPNPTKGNIQLVAKLNNQNNVKIEFLDKVGRVLDTYQYNQVIEINRNFDISNYSSGSYIVRFNNKHYFKIVKN